MVIRQLVMYIIITCIDEPASNEKLLRQLIGQQQQQIIRLLSLMAQPTTIQAPANAVSKETNDMSVNTPISVPIATTAQASQQMTLETLLSDDFNGTACTTDDELDFQTLHHGNHICHQVNKVNNMLGHHMVGLSINIFSQVSVNTFS